MVGVVTVVMVVPSCERGGRAEYQESEEEGGFHDLMVARMGWARVKIAEAVHESACGTTPWAGGACWACAGGCGVWLGRSVGNAVGVRGVGLYLRGWRGRPRIGRPLAAIETI